MAEFPVDNKLTAITMAFKQDNLIADKVLPRVPVPTKNFRYIRYNYEDTLTIPETKVSPKSVPNMVEFGGQEVAARVEDYALEDFLPYDDIEQAPDGHDPEGFTVEALTQLILLDREVRTAKKVFDPGSYASGYKVALSGTSQWSDPQSDPIADILIGIDKLILKPNVLVLGQATWLKLRTHPRVIDAIKGGGTQSGLARREEVAELFEIEQVLVGEAWINTASKGKPAQLVRAWGKHAALLYVNTPQLISRGGPTFGFTAQWGERFAGRLEDQRRGIRGGVVIRVGESVGEVISSNVLGYLIQDAVA